MKFLIVGLGSIGKRHLRNLRALEPNAEIAVWRQKNTSDIDIPEFADLLFHSSQQVLEYKPQASIICNPANLHMETAADLLKAGSHMLIEKPLSNNLDRAAELLYKCDAKNLILMVAYCMRFHPSIQAVHHGISEGVIGKVLYAHAEVGQYLPDWRPESDYRESVSARKNLGGGALLELSHEIDYMRMMLGNPHSVTAKLATLSDLEIDVEDTAELLLDFDDGVLANIHLDLIARPASRKVTIRGSKGTIEADILKNEVRYFTAKHGEWKILPLAREWQTNNMYLDMLKNFLLSVKRESAPRITGMDGVKVLEIIAAARKSANDGRSVKI
jgi:predicted dehydrogenase